MNTPPLITRNSQQLYNLIGREILKWKNTNFSGSQKPWQSTGHLPWPRTCLKQLYVSTTVWCQTSVSAANSDKSSGACTCLHLCYVDRQQVSRIVVDSIAQVVYTTKLSQLLHTLDPSFDSSALINHANKLKETALHMACMMKRSKVTPWIWMHASRVLIVPWAQCSAPLVAMTWTRSLKNEGMQCSVCSFCKRVTAWCLSTNPSLKKGCRCSHSAPSQLTLAASYIAPSPLQYILQQLLKSHPDLKSAHTHTGATPLQLAVSRVSRGVNFFCVCVCFFVTLKLVWGFLRTLSVQSVLPECVCRKVDEGADEKWCKYLFNCLSQDSKLGLCFTIFCVIWSHAFTVVIHFAN